MISIALGRHITLRPHYAAKAPEPEPADVTLALLVSIHNIGAIYFAFLPYDRSNVLRIAGGTTRGCLAHINQTECRDDLYCATCTNNNNGVGCNNQVFILRVYVGQF